MTPEKSKYHEFLKKVLNEFSKENKDKLEKCNVSIKITSGKYRNKDVVEYNPDYLFKFKTGKKSYEYIMFEFLDSQSYEGIIADIMECACIDNCRILLFLAKSKEKHELAIRHRNVMCDFLDRINGGKNLLDVVNLHIPQEMNNEKIKDIIYAEINKRIKLPDQPFILGKSNWGGRGKLG